MKAIVTKPFGLFLLFLSLAVAETFIFYLLLQMGLLQSLLTQDVSYLSRVILSIYALASLHAIYVSHRLSTETFARNGDHAGESAFRRVQQLYHRLQAGNRDYDESVLLEVFEGRCRESFSYGYVIADLMLKLGLLGTVVGFIFMLGSLNNLGGIDINVMQRLLGEMSGGMKVALFTTLTGMSAGVLLNMKYHLLDWSVDSLVTDIREISLRYRQ